MRSVGGRWGVLGGQNSPQTHSKPSQNELGDPNNNSVMSMQSFRSQERCPSGRGGRGEGRGRGARWGKLSGGESPQIHSKPSSNGLGVLNNISLMPIQSFRAQEQFTSDRGACGMLPGRGACWGSIVRHSMEDNCSTRSVRDISIVS